MRQIASVEIHSLVNELQPKIAGGFVKKFYDLGDGAFKLGFHKEGKSTTVYCKLLQTFNETRLTENAGEPTQFAMGIRKRIEGCKVKSLGQHGTDRIIILEIFSDGGIRKLIIEMFGKGNMVLTDPNGIIELCHSSISFKDREIRPRAEYRFPKSDALDIWETSESIILKSIEPTIGKAKAMSELSRTIDVGPLYLENLFNLAGINPKGMIIDERGAESLAKVINTFAVQSNTPDPRIYRSESTTDYAILPIKKYEEQGMEITRFESVSEMFDALHSTERSSISNVEGEKRIAELMANIKKQEELVIRLKSDAETYRKAGTILMTRMDEVNSLIGYMAQNRRATLDEIRSTFKGLRIKRLDLKNKTITIEVELE